MTTVSRVVLIDDSDDDNFFHSIVIKDAGFDGELIIFESGVAALDFLRTADLQRPTLIFLDINMPLMDGFEFAELASPILAGTPSVTIVMLTSSPSPNDRQRAEGIETIRGFMTKPLTKELVMKLLSSPPSSANWKFS